MHRVSRSATSTCRLRNLSSESEMVSKIFARLLHSHGRFSPHLLHQCTISSRSLHRSAQRKGRPDWIDTFPLRYRCERAMLGSDIDTLASTVGPWRPHSRGRQQHACAFWSCSEQKRRTCELAAARTAIAMTESTVRDARWYNADETDEKERSEPTPRRRKQSVRGLDGTNGD